MCDVSFTVSIPLSRIQKVQEQMCDGYCYFAFYSTDQDVLDKHCEECPLNNIRDDEFWKNGRDD